MNRDGSPLPAADAALKQLVAAMCDGTITPAERDQLQTRLNNEPSSLAYYISYLDLHAQLQWRCRGDVEVNLAQHSPAKLPILLRLKCAVLRPTPLSLTMAFLVIASLLTTLAFLSAPIYRAVTRARENAEPLFVAEVSRTNAAVWRPARPANSGTQLLMTGDEVELVSGLAEIEFHRGVRVTLEGPAVLRITGDNAAALDRGKLVARVADSAHGFEVQTPVAKVRDLGTEFAVAVASAGATDLHVFQGKVEVLPANAASASSDSTYFVVAGERLEIPATGVAVRSKSVDASALFVRRVPRQANELFISEEYVQAVREAGPAVYWRFESAADGRIANEMSPDHELNIVGGVRLLASDDANNSAVFGGSKQAHYMLCRDARPLAGGEYTIELWCQSYTQSPTRMTLIGLPSSLAVEFDARGSIDPRQHWVRFVHRSPPANLGGVEVHANGTSTVGQWHYVVAIYEPSALRLFIDGTLAARSAASNPPPLELTGDALMIGRLEVAGTQTRPFVGRLDEVAIYRRALKEAEVREHYELAKLPSKGSARNSVTNGHD